MFYRNMDTASNISIVILTQSLIHKPISSVKAKVGIINLQQKCLKDISTS